MGERGRGVILLWHTSRACYGLDEIINFSFEMIKRALILCLVFKYAIFKFIRHAAIFFCMRKKIVIIVGTHFMKSEKVE